MEAIISFLGTHWILFLVAAILLVFALIGYIVDSNSIVLDKPETIKANKDEKVEVLTTNMDNTNNVSLESLVEKTAKIPIVKTEPQNEQKTQSEQKNQNVQNEEKIQENTDDYEIDKKLIEGLDIDTTNVSKDELKKLIEEKYGPNATYKK